MTTAGDVVRRGASTLSMLVLGAVSLAAGGRDLKLKLRKSQALLAYLALCQGLSETREKLVGLLWSESEGARAHGSLRQVLGDIRRAFGELGIPGFAARKQSIMLERKALDVDLWSVVEEAEAFRPHPLLLSVPRLAETVLDGLEDVDPSFRVWLLAYRQNLQDRLLRALENGLKSEAVDEATRVSLAEAIANLEPTNEIACRTLMTARAKAGDIAGALRFYNDLWDLLTLDYDMEPSEPTQRLVADIKSGRFVASFRKEDWQGAVAPAITSAPPRSIDAAYARTFQSVSKLELAIQPFDAQGVAPDKLHFVRGFQQSLVANLVRFREWYVTDLSSKPRDAGAPLSAAGRYTLSAIAHLGRNTVNLVLGLVETSRNVYVWSDEFELKLESWFSEQQRIIRRIATSLNVHVSVERLARFAAAPDIALEVYDQWLRADDLLLSFSPEGSARAAEISRQIIAQAPDFGAAYMTLARIDNIAHIVHPGIFRDRAQARETLELAKTAVRIDPLDTRAHLCLGWTCGMAGRFSDALLHMDLAAELNPNDPWTLISAANFHAYCAQFDRAKKLADRALELTLLPSRTHWAYDACIKFLSGDYEGTLRAADNAADRIKASTAWKAAALCRLGRRHEAAAEALHFLGRARQSWFGRMPASDENITRWLLHLYPIRYERDWKKLYDALGAAGLPVDGNRFDDW